MSTPTYLTVAEVAEALGASEYFVAQELKKKRLRGAKLSGRLGWRIEPADLAKYVTAHMNVSRVRGQES